MMGITRNVALKYNNQQPTLSLEETSEAELQTVEDEEREIRGVPWTEVVKLIDNLPRGYGQVFRLSVFEGMTHKEIAAMLGIEPHSSSSVAGACQKDDAKDDATVLGCTYADHLFPHVLSAQEGGYYHQGKKDRHLQNSKGDQKGETKDLAPEACDRPTAFHQQGDQPDRRFCYARLFVGMVRWGAELPRYASGRYGAETEPKDRGPTQGYYSYSPLAILSPRNQSSTKVVAGFCIRCPHG